MKKILAGIGSVLLLVAPFTTIMTHYGYKYNLFSENGFGPLGKILYGMIVVGVVMFILSLVLKKRWISVIGLILSTLALLFLIFAVASGNGSDTISAGMYLIIAGGIILWISFFIKSKES